MISFGIHPDNPGPSSHRKSLNSITSAKPLLPLKSNIYWTQGLGPGCLWGTIIQSATVTVTSNVSLKPYRRHTQWAGPALSVSCNVHQPAGTAFAQKFLLGALHASLLSVTMMRSGPL